MVLARCRSCVGTGRSARGLLSSRDPVSGKRAVRSVTRVGVDSFLLDLRHPRGHPREDRLLRRARPRGWPGNAKTASRGGRNRVIGRWAENLEPSSACWRVGAQAGRKGGVPPRWSGATAVKQEPAGVGGRREGLPGSFSDLRGGQPLKDTHCRSSGTSPIARRGEPDHPSSPNCRGMHSRGARVLSSWDPVNGQRAAPHQPPARDRLLRRARPWCWPGTRKPPRGRS